MASIVALVITNMKPILHLPGLYAVSWYQQGCKAGSAWEYASMQKLNFAHFSKKIRKKLDALTSYHMLFACKVRNIETFCRSLEIASMQKSNFSYFTKNNTENWRKINRHRPPTACCSHAKFKIGHFLDLEKSCFYKKSDIKESLSQAIRLQ